MLDWAGKQMQAWRSQGMRGIWLRVPLSHVALVAPAVQVGGFQPHHAEKDYIMLVRWLPDSPSTLPLAPSHQVCRTGAVLCIRSPLWEYGTDPYHTVVYLHGVAVMSTLW
jgi:hypothetical protein